MKAAGFSAISVNYYQTAQCHISKDSIFLYHWCENLNDYSPKVVTFSLGVLFD
jgi:hypothetical protein